MKITGTIRVCQPPVCRWQKLIQHPVSLIGESTISEKECFIPGQIKVKLDETTQLFGLIDVEISEVCCRLNI